MKNRRGERERGAGGGGGNCSTYPLHVVRPRPALLGQLRKVLEHARDLRDPATQDAGLVRLVPLLPLPPPFFSGGSRSRHDGQERDALVVGARGQALLPGFLGRGPGVPGAPRVELGGLALEGREGGVVGVGSFVFVGLFVLFVGVGRGGSLFVVAAVFFFAAALAALAVVVREQLAAPLHAGSCLVLRFRFRLRLFRGAPEVVVEGTWAFDFNEERGGGSVRRGEKRGIGMSDGSGG